MVMVEARNVSFQYPATREPAINDVSFTVGEGQLVAIVGPNAAGKTTLTVALTGALARLYGGTLQGSVLIRGTDVASMPPRALAATVGFVPQDPESMFCNLRVDEEVAFTLENLGAPSGGMADAIRRA